MYSGKSVKCFEEGIRAEEPISILKKFLIEYAGKDRQTKLLSRCPAILDELQNVYGVKSYYDYSLKIDSNDYISTEELWACTTCNACTQACPLNIDPLSIIVDLRRYLVMEQSAAPTELNMMFTNVENNGAPWQFPAADRLKWKDE